MSTLTVATPVRRLSAVTVGRAGTVHAGYLGTAGTPDAPRYAPLCGAGRRYPDADSPLSIATGEPVSHPITCRNCARNHPDAVAAIDAAEHVAQGTAPAPVADPAPAPSVVWGMIASAGGGVLPSSPMRRLRRAWVGMALRNVYGLDPIALDGRALDADAIRAREADPRDVDTCAREYLAAYAAIIYGDSRTEPVDRLAFAYAAPDDAAQVDAGDRPPVGGMVTLAGESGWWDVVERSEGEQRRYPCSIRVRRPGHCASASTALANVTAVALSYDPPALTDAPADWQPVELRGAQVSDGVGEWEAYAVGGRWPVYVGEVWHNRRGEWSAHRRGWSPADGHASGPAALAAVGWLPTARADLVATTRDARIVLPDGSAAHVLAAESSDDTVTLHVAVVSQLTMATPCPVPALAGAGDVTDGEVTYRLTFPAGELLALDPPCEECDAPAGAACAVFCPAAAA